MRGAIAEYRNPVKYVNECKRSAISYYVWMWIY